MITDRIRKYRLDHILFWLSYTLFWLTVSGGLTDAQQIKSTLIVVSFHALASYFNIYVLVPLLLQQQKYFSYAVGVMLTVTLTCFPLAYLLSVANPGTVSPQNLWSPEFFVFNSFTTSYAVAITLILRLLLQWYQREKEKADLLRINSETELKYLKLQINPHFLFNCLNSIYSLSLKKSDDAPETILKLSEMLRYILYEAGEKKVMIERELNYLQNYLELEKIRMGNRGKITFETEIDEDAENYLIEPMLLMPFVENSFKHGLNLQATDGWVNIVLNVTHGKLHFSISNNKGKRAPQNGQETIGGIGIENVKKRLELLYPGRHTITITEDEKVYTVVLELMLM